MKPEQMAAELEAAGWTHRGVIWRSPDGEPFLGPFGAWKAMKKLQAESSETAD